MFYFLRNKRKYAHLFFQAFDSFLQYKLSDQRKSISLNSDLFHIIGVLDEYCVISGFMGVSNMVNLGAAAADSDNNSGVGGGNISDEVDEIVGDTNSYASVPTA